VVAGPVLGVPQKVKCQIGQDVWQVGCCLLEKSNTKRKRKLAAEQIENHHLFGVTGPFSL